MGNINAVVVEDSPMPGTVITMRLTDDMGIENTILAKHLDAAREGIENILTSEEDAVIILDISFPNKEEDRDINPSAGFDLVKEYQGLIADFNSRLLIVVNSNKKEEQDELAIKLKNIVANKDNIRIGKASKDIDTLLLIVSDFMKE